MRLYVKAVDHCGRNLKRFEFFYRNKPRPYWDQLHASGAIMRTYMKDQNGQPAAPINGRIICSAGGAPSHTRTCLMSCCPLADTLCGLFFNVRLMRNGLPDFSPFGDVRMSIAARALFTPAHHLYFADFYCNHVCHYVTVVICRPGSVADSYCCKTLIALPVHDNPFLTVWQGLFPDELVFCFNPRVWVEAFFTEDIPLWWGTFDVVRSSGQSTPGGLHNNKYCAICNLYPLDQNRKRPAELITEEIPSKRMRGDFDETQCEQLKPSEEEQEERSVTDALITACNSTFHLVMEMERERLRSACASSTSTSSASGVCARAAAAGDADVVETVCELVDSVIATVGREPPMPTRTTTTRADVAEPDGMHRRRRRHTKTDAETAQEETETASTSTESELPVTAESSDENSPVTDLAESSPGGRITLESVQTSHEQLTQKWKLLQSTLGNLQESILSLERKTNPLFSCL